MKIAILSDIHANATALEQVLGAIQDVQQTWFLGDAVDRGPQSEPVIRWWMDLNQQAGARWLMGNHDAMLAEILTPAEMETINAVHREDNQFHRQEIQALPELLDFVQENFTRQACEPQEVIQDGALYVLTHASLIDGLGLYTYVYSWKVEITLPNEFTALEKRCQNAGMPGIMLCGHTHVPMLCSAQRGGAGEWEIRSEKVLAGHTYPLDPSRLWIINPGSVGQPRDLDKRAAFAVLDAAKRSVTFHRVEYDWRSVARELIRLGRHQIYPQVLRDAAIDSITPDEWIQHYQMAKEESDEL